MDFRIGARVGPFMVSTPIGGRGRKVLRHSAPLPQVCDELRADGWKLSRPGDAVIAAKGWTTLRIEQVPGGVQAQRVTSTRTVVAVMAAVLLLVAACCGPGFYDMATS